MLIKPFQGLDRMSVYVCFTDNPPRDPMNLGILLARGELFDPPAEFFQCELVFGPVHGEVGYKISPVPVSITDVNVKSLRADCDLRLRAAVKLNKAPLNKEKLKAIRGLLAPRYPLQWKTQEECLAPFLACIGFVFSHDDRFKRKDKLAQRVIALGNDPKRKDTVFSIWAAIPPKQSVLTNLLGKMKKTKKKKETP